MSANVGEDEAVWVDPEGLCDGATAVDASAAPIAERGTLVAPSVSVGTASETLRVLASFVNDLGPVVSANLTLLARSARVGALEPMLADDTTVDACPADQD